MWIYPFNIETLKQELIIHFGNNNTQPDSHKILEELNYSNCFDLTNKQYRQLTKKMLQYVDQGAYQLRDYQTAFVWATRFQNFLGYDFDKLLKRFKRGIKKGRSNYQYVDGLDFYMSIGQEVERQKEVQELTRFCIDINDQLLNQTINSEIETLFELFKSDFQSFITKFAEKDFHYKFEPFWSKIKFSQLITAIMKLKNSQIRDLSFYFGRRYRQDVFKGLYPEKGFVMELRQTLQNEISKRERRTLKTIALEMLIESLKDGENNFPS